MFRAEDEEMVVGIAAQSAIAIENARLYQERTRTAQTLQRALLPPDHFGDRVTWSLQGTDGRAYEVTAPYLPPDEISWDGPASPSYPELELAFATETYALYRHTGGR